jgi:methyl-accepting chemotaxis protein
MIREIDRASEQQREDIEMINQVVFKIDEVTQHGAALLEQTAALADSLDQRATNLNPAMSASKPVGEG